jgi:hypothetical protein
MSTRRVNDEHEGRPCHPFGFVHSPARGCLSKAYVRARVCHVLPYARGFCGLHSWVSLRFHWLLSGRWSRSQVKVCVSFCSTPLLVCLFEDEFWWFVSYMFPVWLSLVAPLPFPFVPDNHDHIQRRFLRAGPFLRGLRFHPLSGGWLQQASGVGKEAEARALLSSLDPGGVLLQALLAVDRATSVRFLFPPARLPAWVRRLLATAQGAQLLSEQAPVFQGHIMQDPTGRFQVGTPAATESHFVNSGLGYVSVEKIRCWSSAAVAASQHAAPGELQTPEHSRSRRRVFGASAHSVEGLAAALRSLTAVLPCAGPLGPVPLLPLLVCLLRGVQGHRRLPQHAPGPGAGRAGNPTERPATAHIFLL